MQLNQFTFHAPTTLKEAVDLYSQKEDIKIKAGGTFLINTLKRIKKRGGKSPAHILSLKHLPELKNIQYDGKGVTIGSMVTMKDILSSDSLRDNASVLKIIALSVGNTPIRNMATLGGNLTCRYTWTEMPAAMVALDAQLHFIGSDHKEEVISAEDFFNAGAKTKKILIKVFFKRNKEDLFAYQRATKTAAQDIPLLAVCVGGKVTGDKIQNARIVINNGISFVKRDTSLENFLEKQNSLKKVIAKEIPGLAQDIYTSRSDDYKHHMFGVCLKRALGELTNG